MSDVLKDLIKEINKNKEIAEMELGENPQTHTTKLGHIKRAKLNIEELTEQYTEELKNRVVFILVTGDKAEEFAKISESDDIECSAIRAEGFYEFLTKDVHPKLYDKTVTSATLFDVVETSFEDYAMNLGVIEFPRFMFESKYKVPLNNKEDMIKIITKAFNDKIGSEAVGLYVVKSITEGLIEEDFTGKTMPVVVYSKNEELIKNFKANFTRVFDKVYMISSGVVEKVTEENSLKSIKEVDLKSVQETLLEIKKHIK